MIANDAKNVDIALINTKLCPICWEEFEWNYFFCEDCANMFFNYTMWCDAKHYIDKYISYDDIRNWEYYTADKRGLEYDHHKIIHFDCIICKINRVDKNRSKTKYLSWDEWYYERFFLCKECIKKYVKYYNNIVSPWERLQDNQELSLTSFESALKTLNKINNAPIERFQKVWLQVKESYKDVWFRWKKWKLFKNGSAGEIAEIITLILLICIIIIWIIGFVISWINS